MPRRSLDWFKKTISNPFFPKKTISPIRRKLGLLLLLLVLAGWIYFLFFTYFFDISQIKIDHYCNPPVSPCNPFLKQDIGLLIEAQKTYPRFFFIPQNNIFLFSKKGLEERITSKYLLDKLFIEKKLPNALFVSVKEKISTLAWTKGERGFLVNLNPCNPSLNHCNQFKEIDQSMLQNIKKEKRFPIIEDRSNLEISLEQGSIKSEFVKKIAELYQGLFENFSFSISSFVLRSLNPLELVVEVTSEAGDSWQIFFDLNQDAKQSLQNLSLALSNLSAQAGNLQALEYIDLRFGEKIFYK